MEKGEEKLARANDVGRSALMGTQVLRRKEGMVASHLSFNAALGRERRMSAYEAERAHLASSWRLEPGLW